ncbi:hypothetical protein ES708_15165 [subsurface metagenome]
MRYQDKEKYVMKALEPLLNIYVDKGTYMIIPRRQRIFIPVPMQSVKLACCQDISPLAELRITPYAIEGCLVGFSVYDPTGATIRDNDSLFKLLHLHFPQVTRSKVEHAEIGCGDHVAYIVLGWDDAKLRRYNGNNT